MTDERKQELFPFFALIYSQQINPEKYGSVESFEEWSKILESSPEDVEAITVAATKLTDEQWTAIETDYNTEQEQPNSQGSATLAKKGAKLEKLKQLQSYKKGKATKKKCSCGCDMVAKKLKGGKVISVCACGGKH